MKKKKRTQETLQDDSEFTLRLNKEEIECLRQLLQKNVIGNDILESLRQQVNELNITDPLPTDPFPLLDLPEGPLLNTLCFLSRKDLLEFGTCSKRCHEVIQYDTFWKPFFEADFPEAKEPTVQSFSWRKSYRYAYDLWECYQKGHDGYCVWCYSKCDVIEDEDNGAEVLVCPNCKATYEHEMCSNCEYTKRRCGTKDCSNCEEEKCGDSLCICPYCEKPYCDNCRGTYCKVCQDSICSSCSD